MVRNNQRIPNQGDPPVVRRLAGLGHPVVDQASKKMIRAVDFWVASDPGCLSAVVKIRTSLAGQKPRNLPLAGGRLVEVECLARSLVVLDGSLHPDSQVAVAF